MAALRITAEEMGDTVTVTRNSYVHPGVLEAFEPEAGPGTGKEGPKGGGEPAAQEEGTATPARPRRTSAEPVRRDELELLALLRKSSRRERRARDRRSTHP